MAGSVAARWIEAAFSDCDQEIQGSSYWVPLPSQFAASQVQRETSVSRSCRICSSIVHVVASRKSRNYCWLMCFPGWSWAFSTFTHVNLMCGSSITNDVVDIHSQLHEHRVTTAYQLGFKITSFTIQLSCYWTGVLQLWNSTEQVAKPAWAGEGCKTGYVLSTAAWKDWNGLEL